jgi:two-component system, chemotaxis family, chemotaxis protein CheY
MATLLVMDGSRLGRDIVAGVVACLRPDWRVVDASSPACALRRVDEALPDAVLVDIASPGMEGLALAQHLRERFPSVAVGVSSADLHGDNRRRVEGLGCLFVPKPLTPDRLRRFVAAVQRS